MAKIGAGPKKSPGSDELAEGLVNLLVGCFSKDPKVRNQSRTGCGCLIVLIIAAIIAYKIFIQSN